MSHKTPRTGAIIGFVVAWLILLAMAYGLSGSPRRSVLAGGFLAVLTAWFFWQPALRALLREGLPTTAVAVLASAGLLLGAQLGGLRRELFPFVEWAMYAVPRAPQEPITWVKTVAIECTGAERPFRVREVLPRVRGVGNGLSNALEVWSLRDATRNPADFPAATAILKELGSAYRSRYPEANICAVAVLVGNVPPTMPYREATIAPREVMRVALDN